MAITVKRINGVKKQNRFLLKLFHTASVITVLFFRFRFLHRFIHLKRLIHPNEKYKKKVTGTIFRGKKDEKKSSGPGRNCPIVVSFTGQTEAAPDGGLLTLNGFTDR